MIHDLWSINTAMGFLEALNSKGIEEGLLLPDGESEREDFTPKLGQELSESEAKCYEAIHSLSVEMGFVPMGLIYERMYPKSQFDETGPAYLWDLISKVRKKLGKEAIINKMGIGYASRRALNCVPKSSAPGRN